MTTRDEIRKATLGQKSNFASKKVKYNGVEIEIRQQSIKARRECYRKALDENGRVDVFEMLIWIVLENSYVPGTNEKVFEEEDYEVIVNKPTNTFMDELGQVATELNNINAEQLEKNSVKTESDSSATE